MTEIARQSPNLPLPTAAGHGVKPARSGNEGVTKPRGSTGFRQEVATSPVVRFRQFVDERRHSSFSFIAARRSSNETVAKLVAESLIA